VFRATDVRVDIKVTEMLKGLGRMKEVTYRMTAKNVASQRK
jgi:hypothetical protein